MALHTKRRDQNVPGSFFVDSTCIDCDTCYWMAPATFSEEDGASAVVNQPTSIAELMQATQALLACPTGSIGCHPKSAMLQEALHSFPLPIADDVFHCGFHAKDSFGAASYLIRRPSGNILVDSPRFVRPLVDAIEKMGPLRYLVLTHQDDVADHEKYQAHFGCERILHKADAGGRLADIEYLIDGEEDIEIDDDLLIIPVPGHTRGHIALLHEEKFLFTGDHLAFAPGPGKLQAFRDVCWYDWREQTRSMKKLLAHRFEWILPGHGWRFHAAGDEMRARLQECIRDMAGLN